jgi:hypothetical protein
VKSDVEILNKLIELERELKLAEQAEDDFEEIDRLRAQVGALKWVLGMRREW